MILNSILMFLNKKFENKNVQSPDFFVQAQISLMYYVCFGTAIILLIDNLYAYLFDVKVTFFISGIGLIFCFAMLIFFRLFQKIVFIAKTYMVVTFILLSSLIFCEKQIISIFNIPLFLAASVFTFFLLGKKWGIYYTMLSISFVIVYTQFFLVENLQSEDVLTSPKLWMGLIVVLVAFFITTLTVVGFIKINNQARFEIEHKNNELTEANLKLGGLIKIQEKFIANTSHDLRTPLNAIIGFSTLLSKENLSTNQLNYVNNILKGSDNLLSIVNHILDYSKVTSGNIVLHNENISLENILTESISLLSVNANQKGIKLSFAIEKNVPLVIVSDSLRIKQILFNLLGNAIKFTSQGQIRVLVFSKILENNEVKIFFRIVDTGIGIHSDDLPKIFEIFNQVDSGINRKYNGTGLGLAICKELVGLLGGELTVNSELHKGSTFTFSIKSKSILEVGDRLMDYNDIKLPTLTNSKLKILVVDDHALNQNLVREILTKNITNLDLHLAKNGLEAVELCKKNDFDIILMDIHMPELDGIETSRIIKNKYLRDSKIIAVTADVSMIDQLEQKKEIVDFIILKPYNTKDLLALIIECEKIIESNKLEFNSQTKRTLKSLLNLSNQDNSLKEILFILINNIEKEIECLNLSLLGSDQESFRLALHNLKNNLQFIKFEKLTKTITKLDEYSTLQSSNQIQNDLDLVKFEWSKIKFEFENFLEKY